MFLHSDDEQVGLVLGLVFAVVAGAVALVLGLAIYRPAAQALLRPAVPVLSVPARVVVAAVVPASAPAQVTSDAASITVEYGVVKFYFASGRADLAEGAADALVDVVKATRSGRKVLIAGFHDSKGNASANVELARRRALVVQDALRTAGVPERQISLHRPEPAGPGPDAVARRVEIRLQ